MKSTELRIGNWINLRKRKVHIEYYRISTGHDIYLLDESDCYDATPIPLDHYHLVKSGYSVMHRSSAGVQYDFTQNGIYSSRNTITYFASTKKYFRGELEIKSLHQLQNLHYALNGQELEINL